MHYKLVLIDQSQLRQRQRELHASHEQSLTRLPLELLNGLPQIPAHELRVPIDPVEGARHDVLLCRVDRPGEGLHPIRPRSRRRRPPPRCLHHLVSHPAKDEGIGPVEVLDRVTMQVFVREHCTMIAAPVQCDVDGIPKGAHCTRVPPMGGLARLAPQRVSSTTLTSKRRKSLGASALSSSSTPPCLMSRITPTTVIHSGAPGSTRRKRSPAASPRGAKRRGEGLVGEPPPGAKTASVETRRPTSAA